MAALERCALATEGRAAARRQASRAPELPVFVRAAPWIPAPGSESSAARRAPLRWEPATGAVHPLLLGAPTPQERLGLRDGTPTAAPRAGCGAESPSAPRKAAKHRESTANEDTAGEATCGLSAPALTDSVDLVRFPLGPHSGIANPFWNRRAARPAPAGFASRPRCASVPWAGGAAPPACRIRSRRGDRAGRRPMPDPCRPPADRRSPRRCSVREMPPPGRPAAYRRRAPERPRAPRSGVTGNADAAPGSGPPNGARRARAARADRRPADPPSAPTCPRSAAPRASRPPAIAAPWRRAPAPNAVAAPIRAPPNSTTQVLVWAAGSPDPCMNSC